MQKFITTENTGDFSDAVQKYLDEGWRVVPSTHATSRSKRGTYVGIVVEKDDSLDNFLGIVKEKQ